MSLIDPEPLLADASFGEVGTRHPANRFNC
jgi:hypothetical protein